MILDIHLDHFDNHYSQDSHVYVDQNRMGLTARTAAAALRGDSLGMDSLSVYVAAAVVVVEKAGAEVDAAGNVDLHAAVANVVVVVAAAAVVALPETFVVVVVDLDDDASLVDRAFDAFQAQETVDAFRASDGNSA